MKYRNLGKSELVTSVIGFGGFPMGGNYGPIEEGEVVRSVHTAIDLGVTLFDTAAAYGSGAGEILLGKALKGNRHDVVLVSKDGVVSEDRHSERRTPREDLTRGLEDSLRRLQTDYLDLYLIHWPSDEKPIPEQMEAFADFQKQGKIRYGGVSNFSPEQLQECLETFPLACEQIGYHVFDTRPEAELFPLCEEQGLGVMAFGPMAHGLLTGTMTLDTTFGEDDWRSRLTVFEQPLFEPEHFPSNLRRVDAMKQVALDRGKTMAQLALAWVIANPVVSVALAGTRKPEEIEENVGAADWEMTEHEQAEIIAIATS